MKMTQREFLNAVVTLCSTLMADETEIENLTEISAKAEELILALDKKNEKRSSAESKEKKEVAERQSKILDFFKENPTLVATREDVARNLEGISVGQITSACTKFVKDGLLIKSEVGKGKDKHTAYQLNSEDTEE